MANERSSESPPAGGGRTAAPEVQPTVEPASLEPIYTNFARVTGSPEELILDFGLNTDPTGNPHSPVQISQRLVMNYFTAKRLWMALAVSLKRQESVFGVLETDITKRIVPQAAASSARVS
jgi:hypothetical protein